MYKGMILHLIAKILFIASSYVIHFFLGNYLSPEEYGTVGVIITVINFGYLFLNNGVRQAISKAISQAKYNTYDIARKGIVFQMLIVMIVVLITELGADQLSHLLGDEALVPYIKYTGLIIPFMGLYFAMLGIFNGFQMFVVESGIVMIYPLLKLLILPLVCLIDDAVHATELGFLVAGVVIALICAVCLFCKRRKICINGEKHVGWIEFAKSSLSFSVIFIAASIIMNVDTMIVKAIIGTRPEVGYYTGVVNFSKIPYYILTAVFLVLLPVISKYYTEGKILLAREAVKNILNSISAVVLPIILIISFTASELLQLFYSEEYMVANSALIFLMVGTFFLGMTILINMVLSALDKKMFTALIAILMIVSEISLCLQLTPRYGIAGAAFSNLTTTSLAFVFSLIYLLKILGKISVCKIALNIALTFVTGIMGGVIVKWINPANVIFLFVIYAVVYVFHLLIAIFTKLLDIKTIMKK